MKGSIKHLVSILLIMPLVSYANNTNSTSTLKSYEYMAKKYSEMAAEYRQKIDKIKKSQTQKNNTLETSNYDPWQGTNASASGNYNTGNSAGTNINTGLLLSYSPTPASQHGWLFTLDTTYQYAENQTDGATANKLVSSQTNKYMFDNTNGIFSTITYTNDKFDTFKYQMSENLGYSRVLFSNLDNSINLTLNLGPGFIQSRSALSNEFTNALSILTLFTLTWNLNPDTIFTQTLNNNASSTNTNTTITSAITTTLYHNLALQTSFQWSYDSKVAEGLDDINTLTKIGLIYHF